MSSVSQTPARRPLGFGPYFLVSMIAVVAILVVSLRGAWGYIAERAGRAQPHLPDLALFSSLSLAIKVHILTALGALILGAVLMAMRKGRTFHRTAGWAWVALVATVAGSSIFIRELGRGQFSLLHTFTAVTLIGLPLAVMWARRHDVARHRRTMMGLFYGGFAINFLIAFIPGRTMWNLVFG